MTLYVYKTGTDVPVLTIENAVSYTDSRVETADCSETLRADWRRDHPSAEERMEELEALVAGLLFGGGETA